MGVSVPAAVFLPGGHHLEKESKQLMEPMNRTGGWRAQNFKGLWRSLFVFAVTNLAGKREARERAVHDHQVG